MRQASDCSGLLAIEDMHALSCTDMPDAIKDNTMQPMGVNHEAIVQIRGTAGRCHGSLHTT